MAKKVSKSRYKKSIPEALDLREDRKFLRAFFTSSDSKKVKPAHTSSPQNGLLEQMEKRTMTISARWRQTSFSS